MKFQFAKASTSLILTVFIQDSSSTTGAGLGSLIETSSIVGGYVRMGGTGVALAVDENVTTEGTYQAPSTAAKVRIGTPANMRTGIYELHFHNDLFAAGADAVTISLGGATNMADLILEIQLTDVNLNDGVRAGLTALPNSAADAAGGLAISDAGGLDLDAKLANTNEVTAVRMATLTDWINGGRLDLLLDAIPTTAMRGTDGANTTTPPTVVAIADQVYDEATAGHVAAGSFGKLLADVLADTGELQADDVPGLIAALNNISAANVNTEVSDVLKTDTITLPGQTAPPLNPTFEDAIAWLYKVFRNRKRQNSTTWELMNDAETIVDAKATVSDDGTTAIKQEVVTGP